MTPKDLPELTDEQIAELSIEFIAMVPPDFDYVGFGRKCYELGARSTAAQPADRAITGDELKLITDLRWALGDNGKRMQPELVEYAREIKALADAAAQPAGWKLVPVEATDEMVSAYLQANDAYWRRADELPKKIGKWRMGSPSEATADGYRAMLAAAPPAASGDSTPPSEPVQGDSIGAPRPEPEAAGQDLSAGTIEQVREAMRDMLNGWKYIRSTHGDLYGVGWDRAQDKVVAALALLPPPAASQQADREDE